MNIVQRLAKVSAAVLFLSMSAGFWCMDTQASLFRHGKPKESKVPLKVSDLPLVPGEVQIFKIYESAQSQLTEVERYIRDQDYAKARALARSITMDIKDRAGIETATPEFIAVPTFDPNSWPAGTPFQELSLPSQATLAAVIKSHKSGQFLNLLNLAKRSSLLYLKAAYFQMKSAHDVKKRDTQYFSRSLLQIHSIPIYLRMTGNEKDLGSGQIRVVFDSNPNVVEEIQQYEFDRELLDFAVSELGYTEEAFDQSLSQFRNEIENKINMTTDRNKK